MLMTSLSALKACQESWALLIILMERLSLALIFFSFENKSGLFVLTPCPFHKGCRKQLSLSAKAFFYQVFCLIKIHLLGWKWTLHQYTLKTYNTIVIKLSVNLCQKKRTFVRVHGQRDNYIFLKNLKGNSDLGLPFESCLFWKDTRKAVE